MKTKLLALLLLTLIPSLTHADECFDYKIDNFRLGEARCGSNCYECSSEDHAKYELISEVERYLHIKILVDKEGNFYCAKENQ